jgi:hypothetical protein
MSAREFRPKKSYDVAVPRLRAICHHRKLLIRRRRMDVPVPAVPLRPTGVPAYGLVNPNGTSSGEFPWPELAATRIANALYNIEVIWSHRKYGRTLEVFKVRWHAPPIPAGSVVTARRNSGLDRFTSDPRVGRRKHRQSDLERLPESRPTVPTNGPPEKNKPGGPFGPPGASNMLRTNELPKSGRWDSNPKTDVPGLGSNACHSTHMCIPALETLDFDHSCLRLARSAVERGLASERDPNGIGHSKRLTNAVTVGSPTRSLNRFRRPEQARPLPARSAEETGTHR